MFPRFRNGVRRSAWTALAVLVLPATTGAVGIPPRSPSDRAVSRPTVGNGTCTTGPLSDLAYFVGDWRATGTAFATPANPRNRPIEMRIHTTVEDGGFWLILRTAEVATPANPQPLTAHYVWGRDTPSHTFTADWFDSNGGRATQTSAGPVRDQLVFTGRIRYGDQELDLRDTFVVRSAQEYYHRGEIRTDQEWIPVDEETVHRTLPRLTADPGSKCDHLGQPNGSQ